MNREHVISASGEINRLHADVVRHAAESKASLSAAVISAWRAGGLLIAEKKRVRRAMGAGAWLLWLQENFDGSPRTAQRYMRLAQSVSDEGFLQGMSLRRAYARLGIATEPKLRADVAILRALPAHLRLAQRLLVALHPCGCLHRATPEQREAYRRDLRALYEELRGLFEVQVADSVRAWHATRNGS